MVSPFLLRLENEMKEKLETIALNERRSVTSLILIILDEKLKEFEKNEKFEIK